MTARWSYGHVVKEPVFNDAWIHDSGGHNVLCPVEPIKLADWLCCVVFPLCCSDPSSWDNCPPHPSSLRCTSTGCLDWLMMTSVTGSWRNGDEFTKIETKQILRGKSDQESHQFQQRSNLSNPPKGHFCKNAVNTQFSSDCCKIRPDYSAFSNATLKWTAVFIPLSTTVNIRPAFSGDKSHRMHYLCVYFGRWGGGAVSNML